MDRAEARVRLVREWIEIAEEDLTLARHGFTISSNVPYRLLAFHCQQSAEKNLKALLVYHDIEFPYTHDIEKLLALAPPQYNLPSVLERAGDLSDYAVAKRYPDQYRKMTKAEAEEALEAANKVKEVIRAIFKQEGFFPD